MVLEGLHNLFKSNISIFYKTLKIKKKNATNKDIRFHYSFKKKKRFHYIFLSILLIIPHLKLKLDIKCETDEVPWYHSWIPMQAYKYGLKI